MPSVVGRATARDGTELLTRHWPAGTAWASVLLVHGLGEHTGRYEHVGEQLAAAGLDTYAYDQRGNGASGGEPGHVEDWGEFHRDLADRLAIVRDAAAGERPVVVYGHSLGGLVVAGYLLSDLPKPDLAVLSSPGLDSTLAWKQVLAPTLARIVPNLSVPTGIDGSTLSRDPGVGERTAVDPLCVKTATIRLGALALGEQRRVRAHAAEITVPTLVLHGLDDGLVPAHASEVLADSPAVERRTYPGLRHELHNEPEGPGVIDDIIDWLRDRIPAPMYNQGTSEYASGERSVR